MRRPLRIALMVVATIGLGLVATVAWLRSQVTIRGPVLHAIAGVGGAQPSLAGLTLAPGFTAGI
jgi:hypothetical protein